MNSIGAGRHAVRAVLAVALAAAVGGASTLVAAPTGAAPTLGGPAAAVAAASPVLEQAADPAQVSGAVLSPAPAELVRDTGSWFSHGRTLDLRADGTGMFASWVGAFDGTRLQLRLIPAPGAATVAEVTAVETVGAGGLAPDEVPGVGGLVTIAFGGQVRTAHVEWTSGPRRMSADLCPAEGLSAEQMNALRCGA